MNIGRRKFLKFLGLATAGVVFDPLAAIIRNENYFINQRLGLGFIIPSNWNLDAFGDFSSLRQQQLSNFNGDVETKIVEVTAENLVAVIKKYPDTLKAKDHEFGPGITFSMSSDEIPSEFDNFEAAVQAEIEGSKICLTDYEVIKSPAVFKGKNYSAYSFKSKFLFEHADLKRSTLIDDEVLMIHHNKLIYTIHMYDSPYQNDIASVEFEAFKSSLHIA